MVSSQLRLFCSLPKSVSSAPILVQKVDLASSCSSAFLLLAAKLHNLMLRPLSVALADDSGLLAIVSIRLSQCILIQGLSIVFWWGFGMWPLLPTKILWWASSGDDLDNCRPVRTGCRLSYRRISLTFLQFRCSTGSGALSRTNPGTSPQAREAASRKHSISQRCNCRRPKVGQV